MISIWEKQSLLTSDVLIIGAGITGLSTAASIKEKNSKTRVTVLERGVLPSGASTRNAGFACFGSVSELLNDIQSLGEDGTIALVEKRVKGLEKTEKRLGHKNIDLQIKGGYELLFHDDSMLNEIDQINSLLFPLFNEKIYKPVNKKIDEFGFGKTKHLIQNNREGQLDTGKLISSLWDYCGQKGVRIITGSEVDTIEDEEEMVIAKMGSLSFSAKKLIVCTNAFAKSLLGEKIDSTPGRGIVICLKPKKKLKISGTFHYDEGFYYFRDYYGKLIFGGGRNMDIATETTTSFGINKKIKKKLIQDLKKIILPKQQFEIENEWSGIMAFGKTKTPIVKKVSKNIAVGVRLGGMGVAVGSMVGEELSQLTLD